MILHFFIYLIAAVVCWHSPLQKASFLGNLTDLEGSSGRLRLPKDVQLELGGVFTPLVLGGQAVFTRITTCKCKDKCCLEMGK